MLGNPHVRFGERDGKTSLGDGVWRTIPTLLFVEGAGPSSFAIGRTGLGSAARRAARVCLSLWASEVRRRARHGGNSVRR